MKRLIAVLFMAVMWTQSLSSAALRMVSYNTAQAARSDIDVVLEAIGNDNQNGITRPIDILFMEEQLSVTTTTQQIVNIMNSLYGSGMYNRGIVDGETTGAGRPGIVYNTGTVELLEEVQINEPADDGAARSTMRYKLRPVGYSSPDAVFYAYVSHLKASNTGSDASRRGIEAQEIRNDADALGDDVHVIYAGDLNLYTSSEQAWQNLTASGNGQAFDPVNRVGSWNNNSAFTDVHTQSPVTSEHFSGQITGGMDDRFDFQLLSGEWLDDEGLSYISGSYHAFGNNNTHGLNNDISDGTGASPAVLSALENSSDHLPVVADYQLPAVMQVVVDAIPDEIEIGSYYSLSVAVNNTAQAEVVAAADELDYTISVSGDILLVGGASSGTIAPLAGEYLYTIELDTSTIGAKTGRLMVTSSSQGAENADYILDIDYEVIDNNQIIMRSFNWNAFYQHDPNAILGANGEIRYHVQSVGEMDSSRILKVQNYSNSAGIIYLVMIDQLVEGEEITIEGIARTSNPGAGLSLGCAYTSSISSPYSMMEDLGPPSGIAGTDWTSLQQTYEYDSFSGLDYPVILYAYMPAGSVCDINEITITAKAHATIQWPSATMEIQCPQNPETDINGDCIVNLADFQRYAVWWLDGEQNAVSPVDSPAVVFTGIIDGPFSGPRAIELFVSGTVDLSEYAIERSQNGGSWLENTPLSGVYTNEYIYLISTQNSGIVKFNAVFGSEGDFTNHVLESLVVDCDGNDAFRLLKDSEVIDQMYWPTSANSYEDSYMYRSNFTGPDVAWTQANWQIPGNNVLDDLAVEELSGVVPFGSFIFMESDCTDQSELDLNNDCQVNLSDVIEFMDTWMQCNRIPDWACMEY